MKIQQFDFSVNLLQALLWQYNDALKLQSILQSKQDWYNVNQAAFWDNWLRDVFDLRTANEFGLAVWAEILGITLAPVAKPSDRVIGFGFGSFNKNFNHGNFITVSGSNVSLTLSEKRLVLRLRYFQLTSRATVPEINFILKTLFSSLTKAWVLDPLDMSNLIYVFENSLSSNILKVLDTYDLLPRPAGVGVKIRISTNSAFGFGQFNQNFTNGNFAG